MLLPIQRGRSNVADPTWPIQRGRSNVADYPEA